MRRYRVFDGSESAHCCFEATVVDLGSIDRWGDPENICECFDRDTAHRIAGLLNSEESRAREREQQLRRESESPTDLTDAEEQETRKEMGLNGQR